MTGHTGTVYALVGHSNGNIIIGSGEKTIKKWSFDGQLNNTLVGHSGEEW